MAVLYRFVFASSLLFIYCYFTKQKLKFSKKEHTGFILQGLFMFCLNYQLSYWSTSLAPSALAALAFTALIYFNLFGARIFLGSPIEKKVLLGASVSLIGMATITYHELQTTDLYPASALGFLIALGSTLSASAGNLVSVENRKNKVPIAPNNAWGMLYGSLMTFVFCLFMGKDFHIHNFNQSFIFSFLFLSVVGTILSFGAYLKLIETMGPAKAAFTSVISPVIALLLSIVIENLKLTPILACGVFFCLFGNVLALMPNLKVLIKKYVHS